MIWKYAWYKRKKVDRGVDVSESDCQLQFATLEFNSKTANGKTYFLILNFELDRNGKWYPIIGIMLVGSTIIQILRQLSIKELHLAVAVFKSHFIFLIA